MKKPIERRNTMEKTDKKDVKGHMYLHDYIMPPPEGYETYHINGNPLDNRRENLAFRKKEREVQEEILCRSDEAIQAAYEEFREKLLWNRHKAWVQRVENGEIRLPEAQKPILEQVKKEARKIEKKYGQQNLLFDEIEWGLLNGRMSAIAWVLGAEWDESLDT
jgi:TRAP-type mannitol/chloroaromatic compound transport system substrate-binding protein